MTRRSIRFGGIALTIAVVASFGAIAGCGSGGPKRVTVGGEVTLDGKPLSGGVLHFFADESKGNPHRIAALSPVRDGKYNLITTAIRDSETGPGAPLGWYKVYLDTSVPGFDAKIHDRFTSANTTPILIEVVENPAAGAYDVKFTSN